MTMPLIIMTKRQIIITSALIYANGDPHLGHLLEFIQTDAWARFQKLRGHDCYYICGSDTHGTPVMLKAAERGITPEVMIEEISQQQLDDFTAFDIHFDAFYHTHHQVNQALVSDIYQALVKNAHITQKTIEQAFDEEKQMFLPDRYLKGECPCCHAKDQYGDGCEVCGSTYETKALVNPRSVLSGKPPIYRESQHFFFQLDHFKTQLANWIAEGHVQAEISNKLKEWFKEGLQDWDISRDAPYFGFAIPGYKDKYFYVWLDAPVGYLASFKRFAETKQLDFDYFFHAESPTELVHVVGKDIIYFHALFWPAMLMGAGLRTPTKIQTHGFLTVNGTKMSKSRGTFIRVKDYLAQALNVDYLRYYFATKLNNRIDDIDLNIEDFTQRVNADLVGKLVNIASRSAGFIHKKFGGKLSAELLNPALYQEFADANEVIAAYYEGFEYSRVTREVMALADKANQFVETYKPWEMAKTADTLPQVQAVCTQALNLFKILIGYLKPIMPSTCLKAEAFLQVEMKHWDDIIKPMLNHEINTFTPLLQRVEKEKVEALTHG